MALDLEKVAAQVYDMTDAARQGQEEWGRHLQTALDTARRPPMDLPSLKARLDESRVTWLVAGLDQALDTRYPAPDLPPDFTVVATDGSHIDVDRHGPLGCYLINIGTVLLRYGSEPDAVLQSDPHLYSDEADMALRDSATNAEHQVTGALLGMKRMVDECRALARLARLVRESRGEGPVVALLDGSLVLFGLVGKVFPDFVRRAMLDEGLLKAFSELKREAEKGPLALASYISYPRSTEVVNALRVALCPHTPLPDCDRHCSSDRARNTECSPCREHPAERRECDGVSMITDRNLFQGLLSPGERSGVFSSRSSIVRDSYGEHEVCFFYLNVGEEVARVEAPRWVAERPDLIDLLHAVVIDQCEKGQGYPVAVSEAHEQAVVTGPDREEFWRLVDIAMGGTGLSPERSAKGLSKQTRWV